MALLIQSPLVFLLHEVYQVFSVWQSFGGVVVALLSAAELNAFTAEVDARALRKAGLRWVLSSIGGEPLAAELTEKGVHTLVPGVFVIAVCLLLPVYLYSL